MALANDAEALLVQLGSSGGKLRIARVDAASPPPSALALSWPELDAVLPDGGLPRGVVELTAPRALGGSTSVALAAIRAGQARSKGAWCAWLDPESTLHGPGVVATGVELARMLVMRVPRVQIARVAVKVVASGAFEVVVIDYDAVPFAEAGGVLVPAGGFPEGTAALPQGRRRTSTSAQRSPEGANAVPRRRGGIEAAQNNAPLLMRKLALAAEPSGTTVLLLTNASRPRTMPWPVALRVELSRPGPGDLIVRIAKDKRGRIGLAKTIPFRSVFQAMV